jgi:hypothetical protein
MFTRRLSTSSDFSYLCSSAYSNQVFTGISTGLVSVGQPLGEVETCISPLIRAACAQAMRSCCSWIFRMGVR